MGMMLPMAYRPVAVDAWRAGGTLGRRHFFLGQAASSPPAAQVNVGAAASSDIQKAIDTAIEAIDYELQAVQEEAERVTGAGLRAEPRAYIEIPVVGMILTPQEIRSVILLDARQLDSLAARLRTGALSHYLSPEEILAADGLRVKARTLLDFVQSQDFLPIQAGHETMAETHMQSHLEKPLAALEKAERAVVGAEAGAVPVKEPFEKRLGPIEIVAGVGVLAVVGIALWGLLS